MEDQTGATEEENTNEQTAPRTKPVDQEPGDIHRMMLAIFSQFPMEEQQHAVKSLDGLLTKALDATVGEVGEEKARALLILGNMLKCVLMKVGRTRVLRDGEAAIAIHQTTGVSLATGEMPLQVETISSFRGQGQFAEEAVGMLLKSMHRTASQNVSRIVKP